MGHIYKDSFFNYIDLSSSRSAKSFMNSIVFPFKINSLLDVGCGRGAWLQQWANHGVEIFGVDGAYVDKDNLLIEKHAFQHQDISKEFFLDKKFDLVQCLEVAEHLQEKDADTLIANLVKHGDIILFSAAIPGQGGEFHVNEQPLTYWVNKFKTKNYICFDYVRPKIAHEKNIEPWYRYNTLLFVNECLIEDISQDIKKTIVSENYDFNKHVSSVWLVRNFILKLLPVFAVNFFAKMKHYLVAFKK